MPCHPHPSCAPPRAHAARRLLRAADRLLTRFVTPGAPGGAPDRGAPVLDVRDPPAFAAGHLAGSGHLPLAELRARRGELPSRERALSVLAADSGAARAAAEALAEMGYRVVSALVASDPVVAPRLTDRSGPARLWRAAPFLLEVLDAIPAGRALDLACGAGREAVTLAERGFAVEAWDRAPEALAAARALAARCGVAIETIEADLERPGAAPPEGRYQLVVVFRFLHRPLFPAIERALAPGGHLVYETYRRGQERFGRPTHARFLLEAGELARAFPTLETLRSEEPAWPGGPVIARLHARRPPKAGPR